MRALSRITIHLPSLFLTCDPLRILGLFSQNSHHHPQSLKMAKVSYPHYAWAGKYTHSIPKVPTHPLLVVVGHALVLFGTIHTLLGFITLSFRSRSYYIAYAGAIVSWGIVVVSSPSLSN